MELDDETFEKIKKLSEQGDIFVEKDELDGAIEKYMEAISLIPAETEQCETISWLQASIGDTFFIKGDYEHAIENLLDALNCLDQVDNAFIYLRLGQAYFEIDALEKSKENLLKAFMIDGKDIFDGEDEKYFNLIKNLV